MAATNLPSASTRVFAIPELLTNILEHVEDPFELFILQSTNSAFQDIIRSTKSIRRRMFLEPTEDYSSIASLLERMQLKNATQPFSISYDEAGQKFEYFDFELLCRCVRRVRCEGSRGPEFQGLECMQEGSWRGIVIGPLGKSVKAMTSCAIEIWAEVGNIAAGETLGSALNRVFREIKKNGFKDWDCRHGPPTKRGD